MAEGLLFCTDRGLKSRRHRAREMEMHPWDRELALPSLSSSERQQRRCDRWNLDGIDFAQASAKIFCLIGIEVIDMHQQVSHCNLRPFTAAWSSQTILNKPAESKPVGPLSKEKPPNWQAWSHRFQWIYGGRLCPWTLDVLTDRIILKISRYCTQLFKDEPSNKRGYIDTSNKQIVQWKKDIPNNTHCHCC